jgi:uncharacterized protein YndB with AHSA1/START domain
MSMNKHMQFAVEITAPVTTVSRIMLDPESYRDWTSAFAEGSYYEGSWEEGQHIRFMAPNGEGMVSEIAEHRANEFISIRHIGSIANGVVDTDSESVRAWAPAYENYTFTATDGGTRVTVDQDVTRDFEAYIAAAWPKALERLKALCEER